jgi:hypothetical protein
MCMTIINLLSQTKLEGTCMPLTSREVNRIDSIRIVTFILFFVAREGMNKTTKNVEWAKETVLDLREMGCNKLADLLCVEELDA